MVIDARQLFACLHELASVNRCLSECGDWVHGQFMPSLGMVVAVAYHVLVR
jgi:hypothetical protein